MAETAYRTAPVKTSGWPSGIPYIIGNEAAERFSYYGMRSILVVFMTEFLMGADGNLAPMSDADARAWYHVFAQAVYFLPILGSILSDGILGKYKTILSLSIVYCLGHLTLALDETRLGLALGLGLIAIGSGGIKPCVSANVGDQFGQSNQHLLSKTFSWFYFSINFGSFFSTLLIPWLLRAYGPNVAFGLPGLLMLLATIVFYLGRREFVHVPPAGMDFVRETFSVAGLRTIARLFVLMVFLLPFWAIFDQTGSAWVLQAKQMDLNFFGIELLPAQVHAANPIMVMLFAPIFAYGVYPRVSKIWPMTPLRKMGVGFFVAGLSFVVCAYVEQLIAAGQRPSVWWQIFAYAIITVAEVMVSITSLEFFYTQGPKRMKSLIMSIQMLSISLGNGFTALVNFVIKNDDGTDKLSGPSYYLFFAAVMLVASVLFVFVAMRYKEHTHLQDEA
ncbi:MAG: POT family MFS transporter [Myxococcales bacterium]|nr:POT family MFS transporter [Myxococcales bacterium]